MNAIGENNEPERDEKIAGRLGNYGTNKKSTGLTKIDKTI